MKQKTHSGAKKRIKVSGTGKYISQKPSRRHLLINKSKRQKKVGAMGRVIHSTDNKKLNQLLGRG